MAIAASVLLPVLFTLTLGFILEGWRSLDTRTLSTLSIYVLTPCLVFYSLYTTRLSSSDLTRIVLFIPLLTLLLWSVTTVYVRSSRRPGEDVGSTMLGTLVMNAGNFGIPMCRSAFGPAGVEHGVVWVVVQNTLLFPLAVFYAARDSHGVLNAIKAVLRLPTPYVVLAAFALRGGGVTLTDAILEPVRSIGYAMIPVAQLLLGIQLRKTVRETRMSDHRGIPAICIIRLLVSPILGALLASAMGAHGLTRRVVILLSGTPTAVNTTVLAVEFNGKPHYVAAIVFFTTVWSFASLSIVLTFLHG